MTYWLFYLAPRIIFGPSGKTIVKTFFSKLDSGKERPMPLYLNERTFWMALHNLADFDVFHEICIRDFYATEKLIKPGMVVLDVGANIGTFSIMAGARVGKQGLVIAFEPETRNFLLAKQNAEVNKLANVKMNQMAISDYCGIGNLFLSSNHEGHSLRKDGIPLGEAKIKVTTIDEFLREASISKVDVLKIDVEGIEKKALNGALETIKRNPTIKLIVDVIHYPEEKAEIDAYLRSLGFFTVFTKDFIFAAK